MMNFREYWEATANDLLTGVERYQADYEKDDPAPAGKPRSDRLAKGREIKPITDKGYIHVRVNVGSPKQVRGTGRGSKTKDDPTTNIGSIHFEFTVQSESKRDETYQPSLVFSNVEIAMQPDMFQMASPQDYGLHSVRDTDSGKTYLIKPLSFHYNPVRVHCDCYDYGNTFHHHNHAKGSAHLPRAADAQEPLNRKGNRVNPWGHEGACKHIVGMIHFLEGRGVLRRS